MSQRYIRLEVALLLMALVAILAVIVLVGPAHARVAFAPTPLPYSCDTVRAAAKLMTPAQMNAAAKEFNIHVTASQIREARKCLAAK